MARSAPILFILLLFIINKSMAQKHDYLWLFGYDSNPIDSAFGGTDINFNNSPPDISYIYREMNLDGASANICDAEGNLLLYTNGCSISDADQNILENGEGINPGAIHDDWCFSYQIYPPLGSALFLPVTENEYYLFHKDIHLVTTDNPPSQQAFIFNLYYSKINVDSAKVMEKNVSMVQDTLVGSDIAAVKHTNLTDWWFLTHKRDTNLCYKFLIKPDTILGPFNQTIGLPIKRTGSGGGQALFSPDGNTYVYYDPDTDIMIFDFDRENGELSNFRHITLQDSTGLLFGGAAISSNSRFLYVSNTWDLYQFDLHASDTESSKVHIGHYDGFIAFAPTIFYRMQLGPDCKIYMSSRNAGDVLHVIHYPNLKGVECGFEQHGIPLATYNVPGYLPTFPNYRLGTGEVCDSTISVMSGILPVFQSDSNLAVFPNPVINNLNIRLDNEVIQQVNLFDTSGRLILNKNKMDSSSAKLHSISFSDLSPGVYFLEIISNKERHVEKIIKHF